MAAAVVTWFAFDQHFDFAQRMLCKIAIVDIYNRRNTPQKEPDMRSLDTNGMHDIPIYSGEYYWTVLGFRETYFGFSVYWTPGSVFYYALLEVTNGNDITRMK